MGSAASTPFNTGFAGAAGSIEEHRHGPCRTSEIPPEGVQLSQGAVLVEMEHASASPTQEPPDAATYCAGVEKSPVCEVLAGAKIGCPRCGAVAWRALR
eukprot:s1178_g12.t1